MAEVLLTSEKFIKDNTNIGDNVSGVMLQSSIRDAQEVGLRGILGDTLLDKCKALVDASEIGQPSNAAYKALIDHSQYYLAYRAIVDLCVKCSYKITNFGLVKSNDENLQVASFAEIAKNQYYYESKADGQCLQLQNWILQNRSSFPELTQNGIHRIKSNLQSAASCGIWLGGARGKIVR